MKIMDILVKDGQTVKAGQTLIITYSMKIESKITAQTPGRVKLHVAVGDLFDEGKRLLDVE